MLWATGQITGDGPAAALTALAAWVALVYRDDPPGRAPVLAGAAVRRRARDQTDRHRRGRSTRGVAARAAPPDPLGAALAVVGVWLASAWPWGLTWVWQQSVEYHTGAGPSYSPLVQLEKLTTTLATRATRSSWSRCCSGSSPRRAAGRGTTTRSDVQLLGIWVVLSALVLVFEKAMYTNHLAAIILPLGLLMAVRPPPPRWLAIALVVLVPWEVVNQRDIVWPPRMTGVDAEVVARLHELPHGSEAIADDPGLVWRAGLTTPAQMNDTTDMRVFQVS